MKKQEPNPGDSHSTRHERTTNKTTSETLYEALDKNACRHPPIKVVTFNTRGMHNTILYMHHILNTQIKPTIIHLTETKHSHIKSIWRDALKDYKLIHTYPTLDPTPNRISGKPILAARREIYKEATAISSPPHIGD